MSLKETIRTSHPRLFSVLSRANRVRGAVVNPMRRRRVMAEDRALGRLAPLVQPALLRRLPADRPLRVVFVVLHHAIWKLDPLLEAMTRHPDFEPMVLAAPVRQAGRGYDPQEQVANWDRFSAAGHRCYVARSPACEHRPDAAVVDSLADLCPDFVFLTNPHRLTTPPFYQRALLRHLCCYVPYSVDVSSYGGNQQQYNQGFHNAVWRVFAPHQASYDTYREVQDRRGANVEVTGYPALERLVGTDSALPDPWRAHEGEPLRLIYAPHHTFDNPQLPLGTFLEVGEGIRGLVETFAGRVQWAFKPHPVLRDKLVQHPDWGPARTTAYYRFFEEHPSAQLELGAYEGLFAHSHAMVHDCGSFVAEYHHTDKPALFLRSRPDITRYFNAYGAAAADASVAGVDVAQVRAFIEDLLAGEDPNRAQRRAFLAAHTPGADSPSERIMASLLAARAGGGR